MGRENKYVLVYRYHHHHFGCACLDSWKWVEVPASLDNPPTSFAEVGGERAKGCAVQI